MPPQPNGAANLNLQPTIRRCTEAIRRHSAARVEAQRPRQGPANRKLRPSNSTTFLRRNRLSSGPASRVSHSGCGAPADGRRNGLSEGTGGCERQGWPAGRAEAARPHSQDATVESSDTRVIIAASRPGTQRGLSVCYSDLARRAPAIFGHLHTTATASCSARRAPSITNYTKLADLACTMIGCP
jgi:hypothetical protein